MSSKGIPMVGWAFNICVWVSGTTSTTYTCIPCSKSTSQTLVNFLAFALTFTGSDSVFGGIGASFVTN